MATGRTHFRWMRVYVSGYNMSGYTRTLGPLETTFDEADLTVINEAVRSYLTGQAHIKAGTLSGVFDPTPTTGLHALASAANGTKRLVTAAIGIRANPAMGDPCFTAECSQLGYSGTEEGGATTVSVPFGEWAGDSTTAAYGKAWGVILDPGTTARVAANDQPGIDDLISPATTSARGGYMVYHVLASSGVLHTATLKVQEASVANTDVNFADLTSCTTGSIVVTAGVSGIIAIAPTATVKRWLRWQIALGTATSVTCLLAFVRA